MSSLPSSRSTYSSMNGKPASRPKTRNKSTSSSSSSSSNSSTSSSNNRGSSTPHTVTHTVNVSHSSSPISTRLPRTAKHEPLFRDSDDEPSQTTSASSTRHLFNNKTDEHKDSSPDTPPHSSAIDTAITTPPAVRLAARSRPITASEPSSLLSSRPTSSSRTRNVDILAFIDSIAHETAKQEQSLQQWQQTDTTIRPRGWSAAAEPQLKVAAGGRKSAGSADASTSLSNHLRNLSSSSSDTAPASPYSTVSASLSPSRSHPRASFSASASAATSTLASSLSLPLSLSPSAASLTSATTGSTTADNTFTRVRDKMLGLTQTIKQQQSAITALQSQLATLQHQHESLQHAHKQQLHSKQATYTTHLQQQLAFIDQLINDKAALTQQLNARDEQRDEDERQWVRRWEEREAAFKEELKRERDAWERKERERRDVWQRDERKRIKEMTIKGMEGELLRMTQVMRTKQAEVETACEQRIHDMRNDMQTQHATVLAQHRADRQRWLDEQEDDWKRHADEIKVEADERIKTERAEWEARKAAWDDNKAAALAAQQSQYEAAFSQYRRSWEDKWAAMERERREELDEWKRRIDSSTKRRDEQDDAWKAAWMAEQQAATRQKWAARETEVEAAKRREVEEEIAHIVDRLAVEHNTQLQALNQQHQQQLTALTHGHSAQAGQQQAVVQQLRQSVAKLQQRVGELEEEVAMCESRVRVKDREVAQKDERLAALQVELTAVREERQVRECEEREERRRLVESERARWEEERQRLLDAQERELSEWRQRVEAAVGKKDAVIAQLQTKVREKEERIASLEGMICAQQEELLSVVE